MQDEYLTKALPGLCQEFSYQLKLIGEERQPLLVLDNVVEHPEGLVDYALARGEVAAAPGFYPGLRSPVPDVYTKMLMQNLGGLISEVFGLRKDQIQQIDSFFSMVATPANQLKPVQTVPHFDKPQPKELAMVHYLCGPEHGGTGFYRHRQTGFEYIDSKRQKIYLDVLQEQFQQGMLEHNAGYINGDTPLFQRVNSVDARFNRLIVYRCSSLHSGNIAADYDYVMDPRRGRFTITSFLHS